MLETLDQYTYGFAFLPVSTLPLRSAVMSSFGGGNTGAMGLTFTGSVCTSEVNQSLCRSTTPSHAQYQQVHVCTHGNSFKYAYSHTHTQGCFTAIPLAFILPTASYLKLSKTKWCSRGKLVTLAVLILGVIVMFIGTGLAIKKVSYSIIIKLVFIAVVVCTQPIQ